MENRESRCNRKPEETFTLPWRPRVGHKRGVSAGVPESGVRAMAWHSLTFNLKIWACLFFFPHLLCFLAFPSPAINNKQLYIYIYLRECVLNFVHVEIAYCSAAYRLGECQRSPQPPGCSCPCSHLIHILCADLPSHTQSFKVFITSAHSSLICILQN